MCKKVGKIQHIFKSFKVQSENDIESAMLYTDYLAERIGFPPKDQSLLRLVTEEAVVNAWEHGSSSGEPYVKVEWQVNENGLQICVIQKGNEFTLEKKEKFDYSLRGRGLHLIMNIMDKVWLEKKGKFVNLFMRKSVRHSNEGMNI